VLCVIDGDGNIFSSELLSQGRIGGAYAAQLITKGITERLEETEDRVGDSSSISGRAQIWVSVYCNKSGLQETVTRLKLCTPEQFDAFVTGFNQASPLFSIIDVGSGKEAADSKIKGAALYMLLFLEANVLQNIFAYLPGSRKLVKSSLEVCLP